MIYVTITIVIVLIISNLLLSYNIKTGEHSVLATTTGTSLTIMSVGFAIYLVAQLFNWIAAEHRANIINREYGTAYSQAEVFWAGDVVDTVQELDLKRIRANGNFRCKAEGEK